MDRLYSNERTIHVRRAGRRYAIYYRWRIDRDQQQRPAFEARLIIPEPEPADRPAIVARACARARRYDLR